MIISINNNCPHIGELISFDKFNSINFFELKCKNCEEKSDIWICLFCGEAFCGRYKNGHSISHFQEKKDHCICISTRDLSVWCYNCITKDSKEPGSYVDSDLIQKYVDILCAKKFSDNANNNLDIVSNSISPEESNKIKYENFMELLKNNKIKNGICFLGPHIYDKKDNINLYLENKKDIINKLYEKYGIKESEVDNQKLFKEKPELLYEYLSNFNLDIEPNAVHKLLKLLLDIGVMKKILTENIDNFENTIGIPKDKVIQIAGNLFESKCIKCSEIIDNNELKECLKNGKIKKCQKCNFPYEPNILFDDQTMDKDLYQKISYQENYDVCFIIGSNLNGKLFSSILENLLNKENWIIFINDSKNSKINFDFDSVFNRHIYLSLDYINKIYKIMEESHQNKESNHNKKISINTQFEQFIDYKEDSNGNIISPLLNSLKSWNSFNFSNYSIFETNQELFKDDIKYIKDLIINYINTKKLSVKLNNLESGSIGSMLGMAIADAMGHRFEFEPVRYNEITLRDMGEGPGGAFQLLPGQWTDDTSMGLCLADSLIMNKGEYDAHDLMHRFLSWWYCGYNNAFRFDNSRSGSVGLGGQISGSFMYYINNPKKQTICGDINSSGIGSIMRNGAVPICYHDNIEKGMEVAKLQSYLTHQGNEAAECCRLLTYIITKILNRKDEEKLIDIISNLEKFETPVNSVKCLALSQKESEDPNRNWNWKDKDFKYSPKRSESQPGYIGSYAMDGMAMALHVIYYTNTFEDAIIKVVNLRGDSDSVGAVVGQIAGAYYGLENIPPDWIKAVSQWDNYEIPLRGYILQKLNKMKL
jgi:ADP-ribosylglycohydrolase/NAD-dependent SIR2 family protein deacetylase